MELKIKVCKKCEGPFESDSEHQETCEDCLHYIDAELAARVYEIYDDCAAYDI